MCRAELLFYLLRSLCTLIARNKMLQLFFRFREAQRSARNILNHQTFERPSLGNVRKGSVPCAFVDCLEKALSRALSSETQNWTFLIQLSFAYLSTEKRWKVIPILPLDLLFEHKGTSGHTEMIFVWHLRLDTHRLDFMPKVHTSYSIWPPCDKGEVSSRYWLLRNLSI